MKRSLIPSIALTCKRKKVVKNRKLRRHIEQLGPELEMSQEQILST